VHSPIVHPQVIEQVSVRCPHFPQATFFVSATVHSPSPVHVPAVHEQLDEQVSVTVPQRPQFFFRVSPGSHPP
jgi:hypothetical protein